MSAIDARPTIAARRRVLLATMPVVVVLGLAARFGLTGVAADVAGGALYTALVYLLVACAAPRWDPWRCAAVALAISTAIELFQLTPVPADLADWFAPLRLVFGSTFAAIDLAAYAVGAAVAAAADGLVRGRARKR